MTIFCKASKHENAWLGPFGEGGHVCPETKWQRLRTEHNSERKHIRKLKTSEKKKTWVGPFWEGWGSFIPTLMKTSDTKMTLSNDFPILQLPKITRRTFLWRRGLNHHENKGQHNRQLCLGKREPKYSNMKVKMWPNLSDNNGDDKRQPTADEHLLRNSHASKLMSIFFLARIHSESKWRRLT